MDNSQNAQDIQDVQETLEIAKEQVTNHPFTQKIPGDKVKDSAEFIKDNVAKNPLSGNATISAKASPDELKRRLTLGEPGLTIVDARDREAFLYERIMGAVHIELNELAEQAKNQMALERHIYIYAGNPEETAQAASTLRSVGFKDVAEIEGGIAAWKQINGPVEGRNRDA